MAVTRHLLGHVKGDKGDTGNTGLTGAGATIAVGTVTAGNAGTNPAVTNSGTATAAVFNFTIPRGDAGTAGGGITETQAVNAVRQGQPVFQEATPTTATMGSTNLVTAAPAVGAGWTLTSGSGATATYTRTTVDSSTTELTYTVSIVAGDFYEVSYATSGGQYLPSDTSYDYGYITLYFQVSTGDTNRQQITPTLTVDGNTVVVRAERAFGQLVVVPQPGFGGTFSLTRVYRATAVNSKTLNIKDFDVVAKGNSLFEGGGGRLLSSATSNEIAMGQDALLADRYGTANVAVGAEALVRNFTGSYNVAIGHQSGRDAVSSSNNVFLGYYSGYGPITGSYNFGAGHYTFYNLTNGGYNIAIGNYAGMNNSTGSYNIALGYQALGYGGPPPDGEQNNNVALGQSALSQLRIGNDNIGIGQGAGQYTVGGTNKRYGDNSIYIGHDARPADDNLTNEIVLGYNAQGGGANTITLGNAAITQLRCQQQSISVLSDDRVKEDIQPANLDLCLTALKELPVHRWGWSDIAGVHRDRHVTGFLAEELEKVFPKAVTAEAEWFVRRDGDGNPVMIEEVREVEHVEVDDAGNWVRTVSQETVEVQDRVLVPDVRRVTLTEIVPTLWGAVQKLIERIEELEGARADAATRAPAHSPRGGKRK